MTLSSVPLFFVFRTASASARALGGFWPTGAKDRLWFSGYEALNLRADVPEARAVVFVIGSACTRRYFPFIYKSNCPLWDHSYCRCLFETARLQLCRYCPVAELVAQTKNRRLKRRSKAHTHPQNAVCFIRALTKRRLRAHLCCFSFFCFYLFLSLSHLFIFVWLSLRFGEKPGDRPRVIVQNVMSLYRIYYHIIHNSW